MAQKKLNQKKISPFVNKLICLLQDPNSKGCIQWVSPETFVIVEPNSFAKNILPKYYKHRNLSSFIRQLNIYGFSKIKSTDEGQFYSNTNFVKNSRKKLRMIQRRSHVRPDSYKNTSHNCDFFHEEETNAKIITQLKNQNQQYRRKNKMIEQQINRIAQTKQKQVQNVINLFCSLINNGLCRNTENSNQVQKLQEQYRTITYILQQLEALKDENLIINEQKIEKMVSCLTEKRKQLQQKIEIDRQSKCVKPCQLEQLNEAQEQKLQFAIFPECRSPSIAEDQQSFSFNQIQCEDHSSHNFFGNMF